MKALLITLAVLLILAHPMAVVAVLAAELGACAVLTGLIWRARCPRCPGRHRRTALIITGVSG